MSRESILVFVKLASIFVVVVFLMIVVHSFATKANPSSDTPWQTFNPTSNDIHEGRTLMERNGCFSCHSIDGFGGTIGPVLNGVKQRKTREELFKWIQSPWSIKPGTKMPQYNLTDEAILDIIGYLETKDSLKVKQ